MTIWTVHTLNSTVDHELEALPADIRSRFVRVSGLLEQFGPRMLECHTSNLWGLNFGKFEPPVEMELREEFIFMPAAKKLLFYMYS